MLTLTTALAVAAVALVGGHRQRFQTTLEAEANRQAQVHLDVWPFVVVVEFLHATGLGPSPQEWHNIEESIIKQVARRCFAVPAEETAPGGPGGVVCVVDLPLVLVPSTTNRNLVVVDPRDQRLLPHNVYELMDRTTLLNVLAHRDAGIRALREDLRRFVT